MSYLDPRHQALTYWVAQELHTSSETLSLTPLGGDAGFRRYFRYEHPSYWLAVDAPPATENTPIFLQIGDFLRNLGVATPHIKAADATQGFLLVEDFGDQLLGNQLTRQNLDNFYQQGFHIIKKMQSGERPIWLPEYDEQLLEFELSLFKDWFVTQLLGHQIQSTEKAMLDDTFQLLVQSALAQPKGFVHRDFHCRNLICAENTLAVIDFQGGLWGPCTYDLVSLLKDCYKRWPADKVRQLALNYFAQHPTLTDEIPVDQFIKWFDWMGLQRHIKVLGIFARLHLRDHKPHYLNDLPLVIRYTLETCLAYPELQAFATWFNQTLIPIAKQQPWYSDHLVAGDLP